VSTPAIPRDWDAQSYDRVSDPQLAWGLQVLDRMQLEGHETVLDAGCGTGRVTAALVERLPRGHVLACDASPSMVERARTALGPGAEVFVADLSELALKSPVDAIFSSAVLHWIHDHERLFGRLHAALRPGGALVAQCGGAGNVERFHRHVHEVSAEAPFQEHLGGWSGPWHFATAEETHRRLASAGFAEINCRLERQDVKPGEPREYLRTVMLGHHLERLPEAVRDRFVDAVAARLGDPLILDYVRLNIRARRPLGSE